MEAQLQQEEFSLQRNRNAQERMVNSAARKHKDLDAQQALQDQILAHKLKQKQPQIEYQEWTRTKMKEDEQRKLRLNEFKVITLDVRSFISFWY